MRHLLLSVAVAVLFVLAFACTIFAGYAVWVLRADFELIPEIEKGTWLSPGLAATVLAPTFAALLAISATSMLVRRRRGFASRVRLGVSLTALCFIGDITAFQLVGNHSLFCRNTPVEESVSPDGRWKAVVFWRECTTVRAAWTSGTELSIFPASESFPAGPGNLLSLADDAVPFVMVHWASSSALCVRHHAGTILRQERGIGTVGVEYELLGDSPSLWIPAPDLFMGHGIGRL